MDLADKKYFFIDLEGTLIKWEDTIIGAEDLVHTLRKNEKKVYFNTDNSILSSRRFADKLEGMNIEADPEDIATSVDVASEYLNDKGYREVYAIGERGLMEELSRKGISTSRDAEAVLLGLDRQFNYNKLREAGRIASDGKLFVCSREKKLASSSFQPHQKALNNALETFSSSTLLGKPSKPYVDYLRDFSFVPDQTVFIGDSLADVETGKKLGAETALVMSGETDREDLKRLSDEKKPHVGVSNLNKLTKRLR